MSGLVLALLLIGQAPADGHHDVFGFSERFDRIDTKLDAVHSRLTSIEAKLDEFELADQPAASPPPARPAAVPVASPPPPVPSPVAVGYYQAPAYYQAAPQAAPQAVYRARPFRIFGSRGTTCTAAGCY